MSGVITSEGVPRLRTLTYVRSLPVRAEVLRA